MNASHSFTVIYEEWNHETFDGFVGDLSDMMALYDKQADYFETDLLIAGYSEEKRRPVAIGWHNRKEAYRDMEPGKLYVHETGSVSFGLPALPSAESFDPVKHGIPAFDEARREKLNLWFGLGDQVNMGYRIDGSLGHAEVTESGIKSAWLKHWPDRVGEPIDPFKAGQIAMPL
ncbi:hypothetical protein [Shinella sp. M27]|uniref:hypothetical protein n=1 Tax=Shinella sp. M27 TaxID=3368614 RepID=UPI003BA2BBB8